MNFTNSNESTMTAETTNKCLRVHFMQHNLSEGYTGKDADTVLREIIDEIAPDMSGVTSRIICLYLASNDKDAVAQTFEVLTGCPFDDFLYQCIRAMNGRCAVCCKCHKPYSMIIETVTDASGAQQFCPNCLAREGNTMKLTNIPTLIDDVTGEPGAVIFEAYKECYQLDAERMRRLITHTLRPDEVIALREKYGADAFMLHDDFYDDNGEVQ